MNHFMNHSTHMMIDIETLGTGHDAAILQLGAVVFCPFSTDMYDRMEVRIDLNDSLRLGGRVDASTFAWWMSQSEEARHSVTRGSRPATVRDALTWLAHLYLHHACSRVWCHGATFDVPILGFYQKALGLSPAWQYSEVRDTRTLFELADGAGWQWPRREVAHTALADARAQTEDVQSALAHLRQRLAPPPRAEPLAGTVKVDLDPRIKDGVISGTYEAGVDTMPIAATNSGHTSLTIGVTGTTHGGFTPIRTDPGLTTRDTPVSTDRG